ncbi:DUF1176 domain-containing protein [Vibrio salinus]|uniref:DUF1176 domain-containing protein n=1 Tax=Vibrio salinus TaxID=2899784 RepID=UPI001E39D469|nr:DUF1176 domain-containing protein [Vibrio salinus]MCE0495944.1 DUF1176 domain-containing protein [Vibrio salinus]
MKRFATLFMLSLNLFPAFTVYAGEPNTQKQTFQHKDWYLACDNTGTCRAAGYAKEGSQENFEPGAIFLVRNAGAAAQVTGRFISEYSEEAVKQAQLSINGHSFGKLGPKGTLTKTQINGLLKVAKSNANIVITLNQSLWRISDRGMTAVFLKMDEMQGRVKTSSAMVSKGNRSLEKVFPEKSKPVIHQSPVQDKETQLIDTQNPLYKTLLKATQPMFDEYCDFPNNGEPIEYARLDDTHALAVRMCWMAAYNAASVAFVLSPTPPYTVHQVIGDVNVYDNGSLYMQMKGRGVGDCWSFKSWVYNGEKFLLANISDTGLCRGMPGGIAPMPTYTTEVIPPKR